MRKTTVKQPVPQLRGCAGPQSIPVWRRKRPGRAGKCGLPPRQTAKSVRGPSLSSHSRLSPKTAKAGYKRRHPASRRTHPPTSKYILEIQNQNCVLFSIHNQIIV